MPADSVKTRINLALRGATGTAYFDAVQLEEGSLPNSYNILENASLDDYGTGNLPTGWLGSALSTADKKDTTKKDGTYSFKIVGDPSKAKEIYQSINVSGAPDDTYIKWMGESGRRNRRKR